MTAVSDPADNPDTDLSRRRFLTAAVAGVSAAGAAFAITPFISSWQPSERARAMGAPIEFDFSKLQVGQMVTLVWRKQPIYVVRRSLELVQKLASHNAMLKDPNSLQSDQPAFAKNTMRSRRADLLVLIGTCTHLGCLPKQHFEPGEAALGADWPGGFFCPCHGSRFDLAGRVINGSPASVNLRVPPYYFKDQNTLIVGLDGSTSKGAA
ncbi:MAG TPA: ubiquinol-cytochrome c reductase iron-sulfur subunit [Steroidobacteraceae bacterium]|nr:ubiquinol-cytochrome c reductase iron-sulfur subunit [Steroidobacteraceae bacterium]